MRKTLLILLALFGVTFAQTWPPVTNFTYYWNPQAGDTVTFQKWSANNDSVRNGTGRIITELNQNCVHFNQGTQNHDSTVKYIQIDTIRGNPDIDSIKGNPYIDSSTITILNSDTITCNSISISGDTTYTAPCSLYDASTYRASATCYVKKYNGIIFISIPDLSGTLSGGEVTLRSYGNFEDPILYPSYNLKMAIPVQENGLYILGTTDPIREDRIGLLDSGGSSLSAGSGGIRSCEISYRYQ